jgi:hypothetical protein
MLYIHSMKRTLLSLTLLWGFTAIATAQTTEDSIKTTVNNLFTGMKNGDAALLRSAFADSAIMQTIARGSIRTEKISEFAEFVSKQTKGAADEQIEFETIKIAGPLATVWTPYKFYYKGKFSHCGVNSFQLVRLNGQWKIQYIIDTRRNDCGN